MASLGTVKAYADPTLLRGNHRVRDMTPAAAVGKHYDHDRLVCSSIHEGNGCVPACLRYCLCGLQLWVSTPMVALVDSGRIEPTCWGCFLALRASLTIHDESVGLLALDNRVQDAWRLVGRLNDLVRAASLT